MSPCLARSFGRPIHSASPTLHCSFVLLTVPLPWFAGLPVAPRSAQVISQHHISAQQAIIFPPVADNGTWRLTDTSSNGTTVDDVMVGKNKQVELRDNCRIGFSTRAYPRAMFALGPAPASLAAPSAKEGRERGASVADRVAAAERAAAERATTGDPGLALEHAKSFAT